MTMEYRAYFVMDEFGNTYGIIGSVGDALAREGVIFKRDGKWRIKAADVDIVERARMDLAVCDFCTSRPVTFDIEADDFTDAMGNNSVGGWTACETCGTFIEAGDRAGLLVHILNQASLVPLSFREPMVRDNQRRFWEHFKSIKRIKPRPFGH